MGNPISDNFTGGYMILSGTSVIAPKASGAATPTLPKDGSKTFPTYTNRPVATYNAANYNMRLVFSSPAAWGFSIAWGWSTAGGSAVFRTGTTAAWDCSAAWGTCGARSPGRLGETAPVEAALRTIGNNKVVGPLTPYLN
jgi:hypothetical protein